MRRRYKNIIQLTAVLLLILTSQVFSQVIIISPQEGSVTKLHHIAVTIAGKPGAHATLFVNNDPVSTGEIRIDGIYDFLNVNVTDGPVELTVEAVGALNRKYSMKRSIHIFGPPKNILTDETDIELPADGESQKTIHFEIRDEWGYKLNYIKYVTVGINRGKILDTDFEPNLSGIQISVEEGLLEFSIQAPSEPTRATIEIEVNGFFSQFPVRFTTPVEPFILVGLINGRIGNYQSAADNPDHPDLEVKNDNLIYLSDMEMNYSGHSAMYAKGSLGRNYRLTASYDSDRDYYDQLFEDIDPNEQYPIYGDASFLLYDAQTKSKFFAKLEKNESFLLLGDYNTNFNATEFTAYNRSFNGFISKLESKRHNIVSFATLTDRALIRDEIRGEGISGYYYISKGNITRFSEKVHIEVRDRYHPEQVLKVDKMTRFHDYDINYVDGTIMFKQPVPSIDASGNPTIIVVFYEYQTYNPETMIGGIRYDSQLGKKIRYGSTMIMEEQPQSNYLLYGVDASLPIFSWLALKGEYAKSLMPNYGILDRDQSGQAFKTEMAINILNKISIDGYYRKVDSTFVNNSQSGREREVGSEKYGIKGLWKTRKYGGFSSEYYRQFNQVGSINENRINVLNIAYYYQFSERGQLKLGYEDAAREKRKTGASTGFTESSSELLKGQVAFKITNKLSTTLEHDRNLNKKDHSKPNSTAAGFSYDLTKTVNVFLKYRLIDGNKSKTQSVFGFNSKVKENTQLTGKYEIGGAIGEDRNRATIGLKNKWQVSDALTVNLSYENTSTIDSLEIPTPEHQAVSVAFEYLPELPWKTTVKYESKKDKYSVKNVYSLGTNMKIWNGISSIVKLNYFISKYDNKNDYDKRAHYQMGLAYRPELNDYFNCLVKIGFITEENMHIVPFIRNDRLIISVHSYWQPLAWLEFGGRFATRQILDEEGTLFSDLTITDLYSLRTEFDWSLKWSTAIDLRYIHLTPTNETKNNLALELNYLLIKNTQVGIGYVFSSYNDPDFSYLGYDIENIYLSFHLKFSEDIFNW